MLKINLPHSMWDYKISGVYKISFSDGSFYIGCSNHLRRRASCWEAVFRNKKTNADIGTAILNKIKEGFNASMDIIELCSPNDLTDKEAFYLYKHKDDLSMLSCWNEAAWKPVLQYDSKTGIFIKRHISISSAARYMNSPSSRVQEVLSGIRKSHKGMTFIHEIEYENRRKDIVRKRYKPVERKNGRMLVTYDLNGVEIGRFKKITEAVKALGVTKDNIAKVLSGTQKTSKGYIWKYA